MKKHVILIPDGEGNLPDYRNNSCFSKFKNKLILMLIGNKSVMVNVNLEWQFENHTDLKNIGGCLIVGCDIPGNLIITGNK